MVGRGPWSAVVWCCVDHSVVRGVSEMCRHREDQRRPTPQTVSLILVCLSSIKKQHILYNQNWTAIPWETSTEILRISIEDSLLIDIIASDVEFNCRFLGNYWWEIAVRIRTELRIIESFQLDNKYIVDTLTYATPTELLGQIFAIF